jgi:aerobic carbon-monoxide dehydrogenase large subunit
VTTTFADYLLPTATEVPALETIYKQTPSPLNPLGVKGVGEVGTIPVASAVISVIEDALRPFGVCIGQVPVTPQKLVEFIGATDAHQSGAGTSATQQEPSPLLTA